MKVIYLNICILMVAIASMLFFIKHTKDKNFHKSLIIGTCFSTLWFFVQKILPLLNF